MMLIVNGRVYLCLQLAAGCQSPELVGNVTGPWKPKVWERWISWGGSMSPKSKAHESSLASPPSSSLHPRHIQTLSKSCQFNLLNISGICALLSSLAANSLGQALFIFLYNCGSRLLPTVPLLFLLIRMSCFKNRKKIPVFHRIQVSCGIHHFSPVGLLVLFFKFFWLCPVWVAARQVFNVACGIFSCSMRTERLGSSPPIRDQVKPPASGAWSLSHWTSREVPPVGLLAVCLLAPSL